MGYQWQYSKPGVGRPIPNFAHPLWRLCQFASTVGSSRGHQVIAGPAYRGDPDDRFYPATGASSGTALGTRAVIFTAGGFTPNGVCWQNWNGGRGFDNGDGGTSNNIEGWEDALPPTIPGTNPASGNRYDFVQPAGGVPQTGMTWAIIIRPDVQSANVDLPFFKRRAQPYGVAQVGWHWSGDAGNTYRIEISDGVTEFHRTSTTVQDALGRRSDLLVCRYYGVPGSATNSRMELWVNGIAEAGVAGAPSFATIQVGNPAGENIKILGYDALNNMFAGEIPFAAVWNRALANAELAQLYADPFVMWRWLTADQAIIGARAGGLVNAAQTVRGPGGVVLAAQQVRGPGPLIAPVMAPGLGADIGCCHCCAPAMSLLF